jgi:hypothetical protein
MVVTTSIRLDRMLLRSCVTSISSLGQYDSIPTVASPENHHLQAFRFREKLCSNPQDIAFAQLFKVPVPL